MTDTEVPVFNGKRLLYVLSGGVQAMLAPVWLKWIRTTYPQTEIRPVLTRSAQRFVTPTAIAVSTGMSMPLIDEWPAEPTRAVHVDLADWPDAILVHPATMNFIARLSTGLGDTPALLALQCTQAPIVVCPSLPPNGHLNPAYQRHIGELANRRNVTVLPPVVGTSSTTGAEGVGPAALLPNALVALEELRIWSEATR